eukprot:jgi/Astpho2/7860/Aster-06144
MEAELEQYDALRTELADSKAECAAVKKLYGSLRTEHEGQEDAIKAAASALASLQEDNKALRREVEQLQAVNARQARLGEIDAVKRRLEKAETALEAERAQTARLGTQVAQMQQSGEEGAAAAAQFGQLQAALAQAEDRVTLSERHLQQHVEATHKLQVEMEHFKADARQAHQDLSAAPPRQLRLRALQQAAARSVMR